LVRSDRQRFSEYPAMNGRLMLQLPWADPKPALAPEMSQPPATGLAASAGDQVPARPCSAAPGIGGSAIGRSPECIGASRGTGEPKWICSSSSTRWLAHRRMTGVPARPFIVSHAAAGAGPAPP
jgi:hypothetical protein